MQGRRVLLAVVLLSGCAVGPDFVRPPAPPSAALAYPSAIADGSPAGQRFDTAIVGLWWSLYQSPALNQLIEQALAANPDLAAAEAALRAAHANRLAGYGVFLPSLDGSFTASRQKDPGILSTTAASGNPYLTLFTPQLSVSYVFDLAGGNRRALEGLAAQEESQRFQRAAAWLSVTTNVVTAAIGEAALREQIDATTTIIADAAEMLRIMRRQQDLGDLAGAAVLAQEAALAQAEQSLPPLVKQLAQQRDQLAALLGAYPADQPSIRFRLSDLRLPLTLPQALPAQLVEQRPDIGYALANLQAASAQVGVAIANRLPSITVSGTAGRSANAFGNLMSAGNGFWNIGGGVTEPLFDGFALMFKERAARAALDQATAQYRSTVVTALQNVADSLVALQEDAKGWQAAQSAEQAAAHSLAISRRQYALGDTGYLAVLGAEQTAAQAAVSLAQAQASRLLDTAALFQALGGGWWDAPATGSEK